MKRMQILLIILTLSIAAYAYSAVTPAMTVAVKNDMLTTLSSAPLRIALYDTVTETGTTLSYTTTTYSGATTGEIAQFGRYSTGGKLLTGCAVTNTAAEARLTCNNPVWETSTITADTALVYRTDTDRVIAVFSFTRASSSGDSFTVTLPANFLYLQ